MSSITYSERIKIETFCELGLSNIQMGVRLNRSPSTISYGLKSVFETGFKRHSEPRLPSTAQINH
ncbi:helix-turn-helix domain-containing protein (plasmid) [Lactiplantibacillus plantarum]|nr:helix-turn-helix domain-containing protein [Lactiplantibacillus plantarum]